MMTRPLAILYEDDNARGVQPKNYGLHALVIQCVCDRLGGNYWELKQIDAVPCGGNSVLREQCRKDRPRFASDGRLVFAVYDSDKISELVGLPHTACKQQIKDALRRDCPWKEKLVIVLLERNIETLLEKICDYDPTIVAEEVRLRAIERKRLLDRDIIFNEAARPSPAARKVREHVLNEIQSFAYLIQKIVDACSPH